MTEITGDSRAHGADDRSGRGRAVGAGPKTVVDISIRTDGESWWCVWGEGSRLVTGDKRPTRAEAALEASIVAMQSRERAPDTGEGVARVLATTAPLFGKVEAAPSKASALRELQDWAVEGEACNPDEKANPLGLREPKGPGAKAREDQHGPQTEDERRKLQGAIDIERERVASQLESSPAGLGPTCDMAARFAIILEERGFAGLALDDDRDRMVCAMALAAAWLRDEEVAELRELIDELRMAVNDGRAVQTWQVARVITLAGAVSGWGVES